MPRPNILPLAALALLASAALAADQAPTFRSASDIVPLFVTVTDKAGRLVPTLSREDFQIIDNGEPQPLTLFDNSPQPIRIIVLIDVSGSMAENLPFLRKACAELIAHLTDGDLARVGTFGQEIIISPTFTRDVDALTAHLPKSIPAIAPTPLWRAVDRAISEFDAAPTGRRVILILSDGKDGGTPFGEMPMTSTQVSDRAQHRDVMIYGVGVRSAPGPVAPGGVISLADRLASPLPSPLLSAVAIHTGGGYVELRGREDLAATFARIADELHRQYLLGFAPPVRDGLEHTIEVRLRAPDLTSRVRKSYVAPK